MERERFSSQLSFILTSVGCAIGLGNIWRFPFVVGRYGGAAFVVLYLICLLVIGMPLIIMEFAVGRGSQKSITRSFDCLEPPGSKWHLIKYPAFAGNYLFQMFYTVITAWILIFSLYMMRGIFNGKTSEQILHIYKNMTGNPILVGVVTCGIIVTGFLICSMGVQKGVEKFCSFITASLFVCMIIVMFYTWHLPGAEAGIEFYLKPDFKRLFANGIFEPLNAAVTQVAYTFGTGMGSMGLFGSYLDKKKSLTGQAIAIIGLDTVVALIAGAIIFPACFANGIQPDSGPDLVFLTLPAVFQNLKGGQIFGSIFFIAILCAAMSTVISAFANITAMFSELFKCSNKRSVMINMVCLAVLSLPCVLGYNVLSFIKPFGEGSSILDLEDFLVTNMILPVGSIVYFMFCTGKHGWGLKNFIKEVNYGEGIRFPEKSFSVLKYLVLAGIILSFVSGYVTKFS